jgi:hypothetical protein
MSYASDRRDTLKSLKADGAPCNLMKPDPDAEPEYDPGTDSMVAPKIPHPGFGVLTGFEDGMIDGTVIQSGDVKILFLTLDGTDPEIGKDQIVVNPGTSAAKTYNVVGGKPVQPDGKTTVLYKAQGRK